MKIEQKVAFSNNRQAFSPDALLTFIQENLCSPLRAEDYEETFGKSYHHINRLFKKHFGTTVKQYHMQLRMQHATRMLLSGYSIQETASACGFADYYFFISSFTKEHGIPPTSYRKKHEKEH